MKILTAQFTLFIATMVLIGAACGFLAGLLAGAQ